jgi:hypothetical protein
MNKVLIILCAFLVSSFGALAQKPSKKFLQEVKTDQAQFRQYEIAQAHFNDGNFKDALDEFLNLQNDFPNQVYYDYMVGVGYVLVGENYEDAAALLEKVKLVEPLLEDLSYYLAKAYQLNGDYDLAISSFNNYINEGVKKEKEMKARRGIEECQNAQNEVAVQSNVVIENIGPPINTADNEYVPLISSDERVLIFTYRGERSKGGKLNENLEQDAFGHYYEDVLISYKTGKQWSEPKSISETINTLGHDACVGLSADGSQMFLFKSTVKDGGDLYESLYDGKDWSVPKSLGEVINSKYWEGSATISADGQTLYFTSDRPGGFGGKDIYKSVKSADGKWGNPINLGASINTKYDEDSPFIHPDDVSFYFSSNGHNSIGGYDIFKSNIENGNFSIPQNLGSPVNTPGNEIYYVVNASGQVGYYSSGKSGGAGLQDIYKISPGFAEKLPVLCLYKGSVLYEGQPLNVKVKVTDVTKNTNKGVYSTNGVSGKYLIALPKGSEYKLEITSDKTKPIIQSIDLKQLEQFVDVAINLDLDKILKENNTSSSQSYLQEIIDKRIADIKNGVAMPLKEEEEPIAAAETSQRTEAPDQEQISEQSTPSSASSFEENQQAQLNYMSSTSYEQILEKYKSTSKDEVKLCVEIISNQSKDSKVYKALSSKSEIKEFIDPAGLIHHIASNHSTLGEADDYRKKLITEDSELANSFIVVMDKNNLRSLKDYYKALMLSEFGLAVKPEEKNKTPELANNESALASEEKPKEAIKEEEVMKVSEPEKVSEVVNSNESVNASKADKQSQSPNQEQPANNQTVATNSAEKNNSAGLVAKASDKSVTVNSSPKAPVKNAAKTTSNSGLVPSDLAYFVDKDLNNPKYYNQLVENFGKNNPNGIIYKVQIGAYRYPQNFKYDGVKKYGEVAVTPYQDGITRFTQLEHNSLKDAEEFRQMIINAGIKDAWVTAFLNGKRMLLQDLIKQGLLTGNGL